MKTAFVILNWNCLETIIKCIESITSCTEEENIIVVDNLSTDESMNEIELNFPKITTLYNKSNLGFSSGVNVGIRNAIKKGYSSVALINPDAYIDQKWVSNLENALRSDPNIGIATGKLINPENSTIDAAGDCMSDWLLPYIRGEGESTDNFTKPGYVNITTGGASLYRVEMFKDIGLFDEKFFLYYEDTEICLRAQLLGWQCYYEPSAIGYHVRNSSSKKTPDVVIEQSVRNRHIVVLKTIPARVLLRHGYKFFLSSHLFTVNKILKGHIKAGLKSYFSSILVTPYALKQRRILMKKKKVSSSIFIKRALTSGPPPIKTLKLLSKVFR